MNQNEIISIRPYNPSTDEPIVFAKWLRELRRSNSWFAMIEKSAYFHNYHHYISTVLAHPDTTVRIAALTEDPSTIAGYAVVSRETLHWVYVKRAFRGFRIARSLVPQDPHTVTHLTVHGVRILRQKPHIAFNPFWNPDNEQQQLEK